MVHKTTGSTKGTTWLIEYEPPVGEVETRTVTIVALDAGNAAYEGASKCARETNKAGWHVYEVSCQDDPSLMFASRRLEWDVSCVFNPHLNKRMEKFVVEASDASTAIAAFVAAGHDPLGASIQRVTRQV